MSDNEFTGDGPNGFFTPEVRQTFSEANAKWEEYLRSLPDPLLPPWLQYPDWPAGSMAWKMGEGEDYVMHFMHWFADQSEAKRQEFAADNPPPKHWDWIYENWKYL